MVRLWRCEGIKSGGIPVVIISEWFGHDRLIHVDNIYLPIYGC